MKNLFDLDIFLFASALALSAINNPAHANDNLGEKAKPIVIAHRGASGYRPEHTLESYRLAIAMDADYIEPDLVLTKDGILIARHEPMLGSTTDVTDHPEFSQRKTTRNVDGFPITDWFASDFTLAEIKTLRAKERLPALRPGNTAYDGQFEIPTLDEVIALAKAKSGELHKTIGIYPELKHSTFHKDIFGNNVFEDTLLNVLHRAYGNKECTPVFIQSFEVSNLRYMSKLTRIKLVQLIDADDVNDDGSLSLVPPSKQPYDLVVNDLPYTYADLLTDKGLGIVSSYADGIGPWKPYLVKTVNDGIDHNGDGKITINDRRVVGDTGIIEKAHRKGLFVHTWTFRNDSSGYGFTDPKAEMAYYFGLGIDGLFTDFPDTGVSARNEVLPKHENKGQKPSHKYSRMKDKSRRC